jgi:hypothetical protein
MTSIFGTSASTAGNRHIVEFRAGRMNLVESNSKKMVHPDHRKGRLKIFSRHNHDFPENLVQLAISIYWISL